MKEYIIPILEIKKTSIAILKVDAIVNLTNSFGLMGEGIGFVLKEVGGQAIEDEAIELAPIQVGEAAITSSGMLPASHVIHAPIMHDPASRTNIDEIESAIVAALELADSKNFHSIAFPGLSVLNPEIKKSDYAKTLIACIKKCKFTHLAKIIVADVFDETIDVFAKEMKKK